MVRTLYVIARYPDQDSDRRVFRTEGGEYTPKLELAQRFDERTDAERKVNFMARDRVHSVTVLVARAPVEVMQSIGRLL
jgi:hypothetical protein